MKELFLAGLVVASCVFQAAAAEEEHTHAGVDANAAAVQALEQRVADLEALRATAPLTNVIDIDCSNPDVTWGGPGDFVGTLQKAAQATPADGTLLIRSGTYHSTALDNWIWSSRSDTLTVCGETDPSRPVLIQDSGGGNWSQNGNGGSLHIANVELVGKSVWATQYRGTDSAALWIQNSVLRDHNDTCVASGAQINPLEVVLQDVVIRRCGSRNTRHNVYLSTRSAGSSVTVLRLDSAASNGSHAFKTTIPNVTIRDSYFSTVDDWDNPTVGPWSTTLVDIAACGQHVIEGNHLKATFARGGAGSNRVLHFRARRSIIGCDRPVYGSAEFNDPAFWATVAASDFSGPANPHTFKHAVRNNKFEFVVLPKSAAPPPAIADDGTYPLTAVKQWSPCAIYKTVPAGWIERSVTFAEGNVFKGFPVRYQVDFEGCQHAIDGIGQDPGSNYPPPARRLYEDGLRMR